MQVEDLVVEVRDRDFQRIGRIGPDDLVGATFVNKLNGTGSWSLKVPHGHSMGELLRQPGYGLILSGPDGSTILSGPTLSARLTQTSDNVQGDWEIVGSTDDIILMERLAYPKPSTADVTAQTDDYDDRSGSAERVIKEFVSANIGPDAPSERRMPLLSIEANQDRGTVVSAAARFDIIQDLLYGLAQAGGIGYQVVQVANALEFKVFVPVDRSADVRMDIENRQLSSSSLAYSTAFTTRAIVAGKGEGKNRTFIERTSTDSLAAETAWQRRIESFVDARSANTADELNTAGDQQLVDRGKTVLEASVTPTNDSDMRFGQDWYLGDKVTVVNNDLESTAVVTEVGIRVDADGVRVGATIGTPTGVDFESKLLAKTVQIDNRVAQLEKSTTGYGINTLYVPGGGTNGTQPVFNVADLHGSFNRFGNMVHVQVNLAFTNVTSFGSGRYFITLPYPSRKDYVFSSGRLFDASQNKHYMLFGEVAAGQTSLWLSYLSSSGTLTDFTASSPKVLSNIDSFDFSATYEIQG